MGDEELEFKDKKIIYNKNYHLNKFANWINDKKLYNLRKEYAFRNYFSELNLTGDEKIFEFGCGVGQNISWSNHSYGYELNKEMYPFLQEQGITTYNDISLIPDNYFDIIITCMVLEHLPNPIETINMLKSKLKNNGKLITVLPPLNYNEEYGLNESTDGHIFGWTFYEINYLLNYCGFYNIINKKIYRYGIERFKKLPIKLYFPALKLFGKIFEYFSVESHYFDIMVVSKK